MEPDGKKQKLEPEEEDELEEEGDDEGETSESSGEEGEEETEEMKVITDKLAQANLLIEDAEVGGFSDKESVHKAGEIFQSVIQMNDTQIEGYQKCLAYVCGINGNNSEAEAFLQKAIALNPQDDRIEEVQQQIKDMQSGKQRDKVSVPKLIDNNTLSERFVEILEEIFHKFDKNNDGALSPTELDSFTRVVNGQPISKQTIRFMKENFTWVQNKGLTQEGFFQLYVSQTIGDPNETWDDLAKLGYNNNLEKI